MTDAERQKLERECMRAFRRYRVVEEYRPGPRDTILRLEQTNDR